MSERKTVYLFHGILNDNGKESTDKLKPFLYDVGFSVVEVDYGYIGLGSVRPVNDAVSRAVAAMAEPYSYAVGHSNGCVLIHSATHQGAHFEKIVYINPALESSLAPSLLCKNCFVYHSRDDATVDYAKLAIGHYGGNMGCTGYAGKDLRVKNINLNELLSVDVLKNAHNAVFHEPNLSIFADDVIHQLFSVDYDFFG